MFKELDDQLFAVLDCQSGLNIESRKATRQKLERGWLPPNPFFAETKQDSATTEKPDLRKINAVHPGWEKLVKTGTFDRWLIAQPLDIRKLSSSSKTEDAIRLLDLYKSDLKSGR